MSDRVQRTASLVAGSGVVLLLGWLTFGQLERGNIRLEGSASATDDAGVAAPDAGSTATAVPSAATSPATSAEPTLPTLRSLGDAGLAGDLALGALTIDAGATGMPQGAPKAVRLGIVLVQFVGAEGAGAGARSKKDALEHAKKLSETAHRDFKQAVKDGDPGSSEDLGRFPRGVLDPQTEVTVFSLASGDVSDVLETPRGYWIVKRID